MSCPARRGLPAPLRYHAVWRRNTGRDTHDDWLCTRCTAEGTKRGSGAVRAGMRRGPVRGGADLRESGPTGRVRTSGSFPSVPGSPRFLAYGAVPRTTEPLTPRRTARCPKPATTHPGHRVTKTSSQLSL